MLGTPADLADLVAVFDDLGITRVGDVTGLDCLGVPVWTAYRPWSRSLSVSQGKGLTPEQARASAVFESIELAAAERLQPQWHGTAVELRRRHERVLDLTRLPRRSIHSRGDQRPMAWVRGIELFTNEVVWVPWRLVSMDLTREAEPWNNYFLVSSNGLAASRTFYDTLAHGLGEVIERDATTYFFASDDAHQRERRVVFDEAPQWFETLAARATEVGAGLAVWDATSRIGIPVFVCLIAEIRPNSLRPIAAAAGMGCDCDPDRALTRAVTEAAQSRVTFIAGCRDDLQRRTFERSLQIPNLVSSAAVVSEHPSRGIPYSTIVGERDLGREQATGRIMRRLGNAGFDEVVVVDVETGTSDVSVLKIIVPGLADNSGFHSDYVWPAATAAS